MKTEFLMKAHSFDSMTNLAGWYASRKLNGFAAVWDGGITSGIDADLIPWYVKGGDDRLVVRPKSTGLWSRNGKVICAPKWFTDTLPTNVPLQGEIWYNDDKSTAAVCNSKDSNDNRWRAVKFMVYNLKPYCLWKYILDFVDIEQISECYPNIGFTRRLGIIEKYASPYNLMLTQTKVTDNAHANELFLQAMQNKWEGIMLANPTAPYEPFRSRNLLKMKPEYDYEATIVRYEEGKGRHSGRMGALVVEVTWDDGVTSFHGGHAGLIGKTFMFNVGGGFSDEQREWPYIHEYLPVGTKVKFLFNEIGRLGVPPSASFSNVE